MCRVLEVGDALNKLVELNILLVWLAMLCGVLELWCGYFLLAERLVLNK
jgi:hypothetical protein